MKLSVGSKIPLIPKSLSSLPGWKWRNNSSNSFWAPCPYENGAFIYAPYMCTCMKMAHIDICPIYVYLYENGTYIYAPYMCTRMKMAHTYMCPIYMYLYENGAGSRSDFGRNLCPTSALKFKEIFNHQQQFCHRRNILFEGKRFILWMWRCKQPAPSRWSAHRVQMPLLITWQLFGWQLWYGIFFSKPFYRDTSRHSVP